MSRSYRKSPCAAITCAESEKEFKQMSSRKVRHHVKQKVRNILGDPEIAESVVLPVRSRDLTEPWSGPKDGKTWFDKSTADRMKDWYKRTMRK